MTGGALKASSPIWKLGDDAVRGNVKRRIASLVRPLDRVLRRLAECWGEIKSVLPQKRTSRVKPSLIGTPSKSARKICWQASVEKAQRCRDDFHADFAASSLIGCLSAR